jgi:hypothetical protein
MMTIQVIRLKVDGLFLKHCLTVHPSPITISLTFTPPADSIPKAVILKLKGGLLLVGTRCKTKTTLDLDGFLALAI